MRLLLDHNAPKGIKGILPEHEVTTAYETGWAEITNGELLNAAEQAGFDAMITGDKGIRFQNKLAGRNLAIVALGNTNWPVIRANPQPLRAAVGRIAPGTYAFVAFPRPVLRRRPAPPQPR
jgi:hypothetical protein